MNKWCMCVCAFPPRTIQHGYCAVTAAAVVWRVNGLGEKIDVNVSGSGLGGLALATLQVETWPHPWSFQQPLSVMYMHQDQTPEEQTERTVCLVDKMSSSRLFLREDRGDAVTTAQRSILFPDIYTHTHTHPHTHPHRVSQARGGWESLLRRDKE